MRLRRVLVLLRRVDAIVEATRGPCHSMGSTWLTRTLTLFRETSLYLDASPLDAWRKKRTARRWKLRRRTCRALPRPAWTVGRNTTLTPTRRTSSRVIDTEKLVRRRRVTRKRSPIRRAMRGASWRNPLSRRARRSGHLKSGVIPNLEINPPLRSRR